MAVQFLDQARPRPQSPDQTAGELADRLGEVKARIADLEAEEREVRAELIALGVERAEGALFKATITSAVRWTLDVAGLKREFGEAWVAKRSNHAVVTTVRVASR
jgi:hypothetical protein